MQDTMGAVLWSAATSPMTEDCMTSQAGSMRNMSSEDASGILDTPSSTTEQPPRRLNINDKDYDPKLGARLEVRFDGKVQNGTVISYDIDAKRLIRYRTGPNGRRIMGNGGRLLIESKI